VEFHPVQPWIAFADGSDNVRVWDWTTQQVHEGSCRLLSLVQSGSAFMATGEYVRKGSISWTCSTICQLKGLHILDMFHNLPVDDNSCSG
jgi:hypothetical protein